MERRGRPQIDTGDAEALAAIAAAQERLQEARDAAAAAEAERDALILDAVEPPGKVSQAEVMRATGLSRSAVAHLVRRRRART